MKQEESLQFDFENIDFHFFVDNYLSQRGFKIKLISKEYMLERKKDIFEFVNGVIREYSSVYGWKEEKEEYFLNGLNDKWKYSYAIVDNKDKLCLINFSSVYGDILHTHCTYTDKNNRRLNFAKIHMIKLSQTGLDNGFLYQDGYWPIKNNGSIILYLRMGWEIQGIRNNCEVHLKADLKLARNKAYDLINQTNNLL